MRYISIFVTQPIRIRCLWFKYFENKVAGYFDLRYWFSFKKSLRAFKEFNMPMLIIDDTPQAIRQDSKDDLVHGSRWTGDIRDTELLSLMKVIKNKSDT